MKPHRDGIRISLLLLQKTFTVNIFCLNFALDVMRIRIAEIQFIVAEYFVENHSSY